MPPEHTSAAGYWKSMYEDQLRRKRLLHERFERLHDAGQGVLSAWYEGALTDKMFEPIKHLRDELTRGALQRPTRGTWEVLANALDGYHAANLLEALKLVPDTGDWHGSLRISCEMALEREEYLGHGDFKPNSTAKQQIEMGVYPRRFTDDDPALA